MTEIEIEEAVVALLQTLSPEDCFRTPPRFFDPRMMWNTLYYAVEELEAEKAARAADREQHEAFRQEVSDAVEEYADRDTHAPITYLGRFIITKPDPMDLVADDMMLGAYNPRREWGAELRAAIEKRGGKIVWGEG